MSNSEWTYEATETEEEITAVTVPPGRLPLPQGWKQVLGDDNLIYTYDENDKPVCGGWNGKRRKYCANPPLEGRNRCRHHGGATPRGVESVHFKTGIYSKVVPPRLLENYESFRNDPQIISLREQLALTEARITDLLQRVDVGESGVLWRQCQKVYRDLIKAMKKEDRETATDLLNQLGVLLTRGEEDYRAWDEVSRMIDQKRRLSESQAKMITMAKQTLTVEQAMALVHGVVECVKQHVTDRNTLAAISSDIAKLLEKNAAQSSFVS